MNHQIAIIGMSCKYPGAENLDAFWTTVRDGRSAVGDVPADRWDTDRYFDTHPRAINKTYSRRMAALPDIRSFAPEFYNITPKRARVMDPQQRLLLECARLALEDAGYATRTLPRDTTGVYTGVSTCDYKEMAVSGVRFQQMLDGAFGRGMRLPDDVREGLTSRVPSIHAYTMVGQLLNMNAANIAQAFDFGGPVFAVDTACSSALVALHEAVWHLRCGITDAALVGGAFVSLDPAMFVSFSRIGALSREGACRPFEQRADGFVLGEGAGIIVLKRLSDAQRDGDRVWAVIDGIAVNNDAKSEGPMTPSRAGQLAVLRRAYRDAKVSPLAIGLVEAHGTATAAGDATEIAALTELFAGRGVATAARALTSVKANVGHGLASSGIASVIKAVLALSNRTIPMQAGFDRPRADLALGAAGLRVPTESTPWHSEDVRRAGVSSFGFGGTNAHVVLSEARRERIARVTGTPEPYGITLSAPNTDLLAAYVQAVRVALGERRHTVDIADLAYTAALRRVDAVRAHFSASTIEELLTALEQPVVCVGAVPEPSLARFDNCQVVSMPPSPLAVRPLWIVDDVHDVTPFDLAEGVDASPSAIDAVSEETPAEVAPPAIDTTAIEPVVLDAIARVSAYPRSHLALSQSLPRDLGFDSLMTADLLDELVMAFPGLGDGTDLLRQELTIADVCRAIAVKMSSAPAASMPDVVDRMVVDSMLSLESAPWLNDHQVGGSVLVPLACVTDLVLDAVHARIKVPVALKDVTIERGIRLVNGAVALRIVMSPAGELTVSSAATSVGPWALNYRMQVVKVDTAAAELLSLDTLEAAPLSVAEFYRDHAFHGPSLRALLEPPRVGARSVSGVIKSCVLAPPSKQVSILALDGALQVAAYWSATRLGRMAVPTAVSEIRVLAPATNDNLYCAAVIESRPGDVTVAHLDVLNGAGEPVLQIRGLHGRFIDNAPATPAPPIAESTYRIDQFPEVAALQQRKKAVEASGLPVPYFTQHEATARDTSIIDGREVVSFSTYNYLGLSGEATVTDAAAGALRRYGTSVSASRVAAGERPVHRQLESTIARFLGCEDAIVFVGGHATNVTTIGHLVGPQDLILHDSLAHDSIIGGATLSGARRRAFAHNDMAALEQLLIELRPTARRVLIAIEGVYSMDGDIAPLDQVIALKKQYGAVLLVDEAHSLGVLGATGRGIGEHFDVDPADVDLWMGTLSKSLASCGGYIAGSNALIEYLKFTAPGFVYSCGLPPASAAAALAALQMIETQPERVTTLRQRADFFRTMCRARGVDTGLSTGSAVVPAIIGDSTACLKVAAALNAAGINVHPIVYPAVENQQARLRFFISCLHSEAQLLQAAEALAAAVAGQAGIGVAKTV